MKPELLGAAMRSPLLAVAVMLAFPAGTQAQVPGAATRVPPPDAVNPWEQKARESEKAREVEKVRAADMQRRAEEAQKALAESERKAVVAA
jgi:hypothetical protein